MRYRSSCIFASFQPASGDTLGGLSFWGFRGLGGLGAGAERRAGLEARCFRSYVKSVEITFDPAKRAATLAHRGLDFADASQVFAGRHVSAPDDRRDYGEARFITAGYLAGRLVVVVWTPRDGKRRVISMRYAHAEETERWRRAMDRSR